MVQPVGIGHLHHSARVYDAKHQTSDAYLQIHPIKHFRPKAYNPVKSFKEQKITMNDGLLYRIKEGIQDMCYIWMKEIRSSFTDEGVLIFCILVPLLYPLLYSWAYNNEVTRNVPVAIIDYSNSQLSREFIRTIDASPDTKVAYYLSLIHI